MRVSEVFTNLYIDQFISICLLNNCRQRKGYQVLALAMNKNVENLMVN